MTRGSHLLRATVGFIAGSALGWVAHGQVARDRLEKSTAFDSVISKISPLPGTTLNVSFPWDDNWDKRDPKSLIKPNKKLSSDNNDLSEEIKKKTPTASRHLLLIRHGQYNDQATSDELRMLTSLGIEQANLTGERLKELNYPYTEIIHSSMTRAIETATAIHKHLPLLSMSQCDLLREGAPWPPEPPSATWRPEYRQFYRDGARIEAAFRKYFHRADPSQDKDSYEIIVCHANVIRYFVCRALQLPPEAWLRMSLNHGSITWVTIRPSGRVGLHCLGDAGHMPPDKVTVR